MNLSIIALATTFISLGLKPLLTRTYSKYNKYISNYIIQIIFIQISLFFIIIFPIFIYFQFTDISALTPVLVLLLFLSRVAGLEFIFEVDRIEKNTFLFKV